MAARPFPTNPDYETVIRGLRRLHELARDGLDEGPEAEAVRDGMDHPWQRLSDAERDRLTGLSADLYSIGEPPGDVQPMDPQARWQLVEAIQATETGPWDHALALLRRWGKYLDPALLSWLRGSVWQKAGDPATAALFYEDAARLAPDDDDYQCLHLTCLAESDPASAQERARAIIASDRSHAPGVVVWGASILLASTRGMPDDAARPVFQEMVRVLERAIARLPGDEVRGSPTLVSTTGMACGLLGKAYDYLGDAEAALRSYDRGLAIDPEYDALLVARGILRYGVSPSAVEDFEEAIRLGSRLVWPHYFLAHHCLRIRRFDDCRRLCERALEMTDSTEIRSQLYEWLAIACSEQGFPPDQVRTAFDSAIGLDPKNERIRHNLRVFEERAAQPSAFSRDWETPSTSAIQAFGHAEYRPISAA